MDKYCIKDRKLFDKYCKDYKYYPPIIPAQKRIIAIGDLHGDYDLAIKCLRLAKVIDENNNWIGKKTFVVQIGDQLDSYRPLYRGEQKQPTLEKKGDIELLELFTKLSIEASKVGGAVISLLGNHEIMNVDGNLDYVSFNDIQRFANYKDPTTGQGFPTAEKARKHAFRNEYAKKMACSRMPAIIIGSFLFVHAGFVETFMQRLDIKKPDLHKMSYAMRKWLLGLIDETGLADIMNVDRDSLFWDRLLGNIPPSLDKNDPICVKRLGDTLNIFQIKSMIIGHTPQAFSKYPAGINSTCSDSIYRIDFGGSFGFDKFGENHLRKIQILEINNDADIRIVS